MIEDGPAIDTAGLQRFLDEALGAPGDLSVEPLRGGGSCEIFGLDRGAERWILRRSPRHANAARAHDVLREFRILDAVKDEPVPIARPIVACDDPAVFERPFYVMERIDGRPILSSIPAAWSDQPAAQGAALEQLVDALVAIHGVDWEACGLGDLAPRRTGPGGEHLARQVGRWLGQLASYEGRDLPAARRIANWLGEHRPADQPPALCHGDFKLDNVLFAPTSPPDLRAVVDWEMASVGDPLVDLAWALIFHPVEGLMPLGRAGEPTFTVEHLPSSQQLVDRYAAASGRSLAALGWYAVFARWKLAIALEGSFAKFQKGLSDKPIHELFGSQADLLLASAGTLIEGGPS